MNETREETKELEVKEEVSFLSNLPKTVNQETEYDADEIGAGGELDSINPSKIFAHRLSVTAGETGQYALKRQIDDVILWHADKFNGIVLHGHRVFKLYQWMVDGLHDKEGFDKTTLSPDEAQVLAIAYDNPKKNRGSFDVSGHGDWIDNPKLFSVIQRYSRLFLYILMPDIANSDAASEHPELKKVGIVYGSFPVSAANAYNGLLIQKKSKNQVLPYCITEFSLMSAESEKGDKYKKMNLQLGGKVSEDLAMLRERIKPLFKEVQALHSNLIENTQAGNIIKEVSDEDDSQGLGDEPF